MLRDARDQHLGEVLRDAVTREEHALAPLVVSVDGILIDGPADEHVVDRVLRRLQYTEERSSGEDDHKNADAVSSQQQEDCRGYQRLERLEHRAEATRVRMLRPPEKQPGEEGEGSNTREQHHHDPAIASRCAFSGKALCFQASASR